MKVNIPALQNDSIDLGACDLYKGILISKAPFGFVAKTSEDYYTFYKSSNIEDSDWEYEETLYELVKNLVRCYPNITFEYHENA